MSQNTLANPASAKQEGFITRLALGAETLLPLTPEQHDILKKVMDAEHVEKSEASYLIDGLMKCPKKDLPQAKPGYYIHQNGDYLVVVQNKAKTRTYAKCLTVTKEQGQRGKAKWEYAPGKGADVAHMTPMTVHEAAKFGHLYGVCFVCTKPLTDPKSVVRGIGPVCAKKF